jgi:hypothetical protein
MSKYFTNRVVFLGLSLLITKCFCDTTNNKTTKASFHQSVETFLSSKDDSETTNNFKTFAHFTGKVKGERVALRPSSKPGSVVIKELKTGDLVLVVGEEGEFYKVLPSLDFKVYVFRSFVLNNTIECNRVNVRTGPSLESPAIALLNSGDRIEGTISDSNPKWYEITPPKGIFLYVAKEHIDHVGGPNLKVELDKKMALGKEKLDATKELTQSELTKPFQEIDFQHIVQAYQDIMSAYEEITDVAQEAKNALIAFQKEYTQHKTTHFFEENPPSNIEAKTSIVPTEKIEFWQPIEKALYQVWATSSEDPTTDEFYQEQRETAETITGFIEPYSTSVKSRPGDFILKDKDKGLIIAYLYSTQINLQEFVGKQVTAIVAPRDNNNFAFPAFFVLFIE